MYNKLKNIILGKEIVLIYVVALAMLPLTFNFQIEIHGDTRSYIHAWERISHGEIDILRTPVYPTYLGILRDLFGTQHFMAVAVTGQLLAFWASILPFYRVARRMISSKEVVLGVTLFYAIYPGIINWSCWLLTESFAISGMVFLAYCTIRIYEDYSVKYAIYSGILLICLIMLRPIFVYLLPSYFIFWLVVFIKNRYRRRQAISGMISITIPIVVLCTYMQIFANTYGLFTVSSVSTINRWMYACQESLLDSEAVSDPSIRAYISQIKKSRYNHHHDSVFASLWEVDSKNEGRYSLKSINDALNESDRSHPLLILESTGKKFSQLSLWSVFPLSTTSEFLSLGGMHVICVLLLVYGLLIGFQFIHLKDNLWISLFFYILGVANLITAVVGANADYARLIQPSIPIYLILFGQLYTFFVRKSIRELEFV